MMVAPHQRNYNQRQIIQKALQSMNRVVASILQKGTSPKIKIVEKLCDPSPFQTGFVSENFPVYPITISLYLDNPPFNRISLCFDPNFVPSKITLYGSEDSHTFKRFHEITDLGNRQQYIKIFKEKFFYCYIRLILEEPQPTKINMCKQIIIKGLEFTMVRFFNTRYVCSLSSKLTYHPTLFRLLEILEYKALLLKENKNKLYEKYEARLYELTQSISEKKVNNIHPEQSLLDKWSKQILYVENEPIYSEGNVEYPDPVKVKRDIFRLQKALRQSQVNNFGEIKQYVHNYFLKYHNLTVKDSYLRYLSSNLQEDHYTALVNFWNDVKELQDIDMETEQAIVMYFNFYLQFIDSPLKMSALKTLILFDKNNKNSTSSTLNPVYQRVLFNVFGLIHQTENEELRNISLRYCYMLYDKIDNRNFIEQLLGSYKSYPLQEQIQKLQILEKLTFRNVVIYDRTEIINFLIEILLTNQLNLTEKNRAYNIAAYLASKFGKSTIMKDFQKLNSMILMTMEKNIDSKLNKIQNKLDRTEQDEEGLNCQYCGEHNKNFKDDNLYDLHLAKQCKFITTCNYCHQNIEIPELNKHYVEQCTEKHNFKHCDNCFEVIQLKEQQKHNEKCSHKLETRCPLCYEKVDNKLKLKEHILVDGCPNNPR